MKRKLLVVLMAGAWLAGAWPGVASAAELGYSMKSMEEDFSVTGRKQTGPPSSAAAAADALVGRPLGLGITVAGAAVFALTLPFSAGSGKVNDAGWSLVGRPAGWTFNRPIGRGKPIYEERGVFGP
jgi:hypothetical protein